jgi:hypothetical protein
MKLFYRFVSYGAILLMFAAALLSFGDHVTVHTYRILALVGTFGWFVSVPFWMHRRLHNPPD